MRIGDALLGALFCLLGIGVLWHSAGFTGVSKQFYGPSLFPSIIGWGFVATGISLAVAAIRRSEVFTGLLSFPDWRGSPRGVVGVALMLLAVLAFIYFGDLIGFHLLAFATLTLLYRTAGRSVLQSIGIAFAVTLCFELLFSKLLRVPLPNGLLTGFPWW